ncbi:MAG: type II toxin-antitoxin system HigB family toxin [Candidatus Omnitrophica bacterium]|nr:type II toxin-antitoxin system HigB family toxin [Candidatus Omnitrophota bacterium]
MRIISKKALIQFWEKHPDTKPSLESWFEVVKEVEWENFAELRRTYSSADWVTVGTGNKVIVFNVGGNKVRLIAAVHFNTKTVYVLRVLTHSEYDRQEWKRAL